MIYYCVLRYGIALGTNDHIGVPQLFTNLVSTIPGIGQNLVTLLWGGYFVSQTALESIFYFQHFFLPFILIGICFSTYIIITCNIIQVYL